MARYNWYILRVWRSGRRSGEQWAARLEEMPDGESRRFNQPDLLLEYVRSLVLSSDAGQGRTSPAEGHDGEPGAHETEPR